MRIRKSFYSKSCQKDPTFRTKYWCCKSNRMSRINFKVRHAKEHCEPAMVVDITNFSKEQISGSSALLTTLSNTNSLITHPTMALSLMNYFIFDHDVCFLNLVLFLFSRLGFSLLTKLLVPLLSTAGSNGFCKFHYWLWGVLYYYGHSNTNLCFSFLIGDDCRWHRHGCTSLYRS